MVSVLTKKGQKTKAVCGLGRTNYVRPPIIDPHSHVVCGKDADYVEHLGGWGSMEKVTSKDGKVHGFLSSFSSKGHWASLEFTTPIAFEFVSGISSGHFPRTTTVKASYEDPCSRPYFGATIQTDFRSAPRT